MSSVDRHSHTRAHHNAGLRWIREHRSPDEHHPRLDEFVSAWDAGNPSGWGDALYNELRSRGWVELNRFGALRLTADGEEARQTGVEDDMTI